MKKFQIRLKEHTEKWIQELADKEKVGFSTMVREILEREEFSDFIKKQLEDKKKRGKKDEC